MEVFGFSPYENDRILRDIFFIKEGQRYPEHFRVRNALEAAAMVFPGWDDDLATSLLADFDLPGKRPVWKLSRGMNSMVGGRLCAVALPTQDAGDVAFLTGVVEAWPAGERGP